MASLIRTALPRLTHALPKSTLSHFKAPSPSVIRQYSVKHSSNSSPFPSILARLSAIPKNASASRSISTTYGSANPQVDWTRVAVGMGVAAVGVVGLNYALNRETRGGLTAFESSYLNETFKWTGLGLAITAGTAKFLHGNGTALRLMSLNPWVVMGGGLVLSIGSMMGVYGTDSGSAAHYAFWGIFSVTQGLTLSPMFFLNPAIISRAALYTAASLGGLCYVGATAKSEQFLYIGGPLLAGLGVVIVSSLAPMLMPRMSMRTMSVLEHVSAYGGVAVFSGFILYDTQKILKHANMVQAGRMAHDPIRESVSLILDAINLFVRIVQVMMLQQRKK